MNFATEPLSRFDLDFFSPVTRARVVRWPHAPQVLYQDFVPAIGKSVSLRLIELELDLELFFEWQHQPRVARFWELNRSRDELKTYLACCLQNPAELPLIVEINGEPAGYVEAYWTRFERLSRHYDAHPFDRGFHILIGNRSCLGSANTEAVLRSVCHFLFLSEPRTQRLIADPRVENRAILKYLTTFPAWHSKGEFEEAGLRHALLECRREAFFCDQEPKT